MTTPHESTETQTIISLATHAVQSSLHQSGLAFAFTGHVAESLYGEGQHLPEASIFLKIEVLLFTPVPSIPDLKQVLAVAYPTWFMYLGPSRRLRYRIMLPQYSGPSDIEVVLVVSTSGSIAHLHAMNGLPLVPYSFVMLRELMFWDSIPLSHSQARKTRETNILRMLNTLRQRPEFVHSPDFDQSMQTESVDRVTRFFTAHPSFRKEWQRMGLLPHRQHPLARVPEGATQSSLPQTDLVTSLQNMTISAGSSAPSPAESSKTPQQPESTSTSKKKSKPKPKYSRMQIRRLAARKTVEILAAHGFSCALFGSMACRLYGNKRIPNDIDVLVLPLSDQSLDGLPPTQEALKELLVASAPTSYALRPARDPEATYRVLYFLPTPTSKPTYHQSTKVDILLPGVMHLPNLPPSSIWWRPNVIDSKSPSLEQEPQVPVVPFSVLLMQKLQGWDDHRRAEEARYKDKAPVDVEDLKWMLNVGVPRYLRMDPRRSAMIWRDRELFDEEFEVRSKERVVDFCANYPDSTRAWRDLGFEIL